MRSRLLSLAFAVVTLVCAHGFVSLEERLSFSVDSCWPSDPSAERQPEGRVTGFVFDESGKPLDAAEVELIPVSARGDGEEFYQTLKDWTDASGFYELRAAPGDYVLAVQVNAAPDPERPVIGQFYPGRAARNEAEAISVKDAGELSLPPFYLKRIPTVEITAYIRFGDGTVPKYSHVLLHNPKFPRHATIGDTAVSVVNGQAMLVLPVGFEYWVTGKVDCLAGHKIESPESRPVEKIRVTETEYPRQLTLTILGSACELWRPN